MNTLTKNLVAYQINAINRTTNNTVKINAYRDEKLGDIIMQEKYKCPWCGSDERKTCLKDDFKFVRKIGILQWR